MRPGTEAGSPVWEQLLDGFSPTSLLFLRRAVMQENSTVPRGSASIFLRSAGCQFRWSLGNVVFVHSAFGAGRGHKSRPSSCQENLSLRRLFALHSPADSGPYAFLRAAVSPSLEQVCREGMNPPFNTEKNHERTT